MDADALKAAHLLRNRLALPPGGVGGNEGPLWDELERAFSRVDPSQLVAAS